MLIAAFVLFDLVACFCIVFWLMPVSGRRDRGWGGCRSWASLDSRRWKLRGHARRVGSACSASHSMRGPALASFRHPRSTYAASACVKLRRCLRNALHMRPLRRRSLSPITAGCGKWGRNADCSPVCSKTSPESVHDAPIHQAPTGKTRSSRGRQARVSAIKSAEAAKVMIQTSAAIEG